jgi:mRNA (guanine-N7-)-methyltransferase
VHLAFDDGHLWVACEAQWEVNNIPLKLTLEAGQESVLCPAKRVFAVVCTYNSIVFDSLDVEPGACNDDDDVLTGIPRRPLGDDLLTPGTYLCHKDRYYLQMPAFDPVRDAALNSPMSQSKSLPAHAHDTDLDRHERLSFDAPSPSSSRPSSSRATNSPTVARRATDLAVLLNSEPQEPRTPSSARPSSLSHLLLGTDTQSPVSLLPPTTASNGEVDRLASAPSLRRRGNLPVLDISRTDAPSEDGQSQHFSRHPPPPPSRVPFHSKQQVESASSAPRVLPPSPLTRSPIRAPFYSPSSSDTPTVPPTMSPQPPLSTIPYNPRNRKTPAGSVLVPMTPHEMELYRHYHGAGSQLLLSKRKRERSRSPDNVPPAKRHAGDVGKVISHCESLMRFARCTSD